MSVKKHESLTSKCNIAKLYFYGTWNLIYFRNRKLRSISSTLEPLKAQNKIKRFITASDDSGLVEEYVLKVEQALTDYQVCRHSCTSRYFH
jgi:hypothetical protein